MSNAIGTCSKCGGAVVMPPMMVNPVACCQNCGARAKHGHGPVIPMEGGRTERESNPYDFSEGNRGFRGIRRFLGFR